jgi:hypothetical protein
MQEHKKSVEDKNMQLQVQLRTAYRRTCFWNYVQCLSVFARANTDPTGNSRINNSCRSLSPQLCEKKFIEIRTHAHTHTPLSNFEAGCPDAGELRLGNWRNDDETRLEDSRIARKSAIKAA